MHKLNRPTTAKMTGLAMSVSLLSTQCLPAMAAGPLSGILNAPTNILNNTRTTIAPIPASIASPRASAPIAAPIAALIFAAQEL